MTYINRIALEASALYDKAIIDLSSVAAIDLGEHFSTYNVDTTETQSIEAKGVN